MRNIKETLHDIADLAPKPPSMSQEQYTYAQARALYETATQDIDRRTLPFREAIEAIANSLSTEEIAIGSGLWTLRNQEIDVLADQLGEVAAQAKADWEMEKVIDTLTKAENALIEWAHEQTKKSPRYNQNPAAREMFTDPRARRQPFRSQLLRICMKGRVQ